MQPARRFAGHALDVREKCNHIMPSFGLDGFNRCWIRVEPHCTNPISRALGHDSRVLHGLAGGKFHLQPGAIASAIRPEFGKIRGRVTRNHGGPRLPQTLALR